MARRASALLRFTQLLLAAPALVAAIDGACYELVENSAPKAALLLASRSAKSTPSWIAPLREGIKEARLSAPLTAPLVEDVAFKLCGLCSTADLVNWLTPAGVALCSNQAFPQRSDVDAALTSAVLRYAQMHGNFWNYEANATACWSHLLSHLPRRDMILLFNAPDTFIDYVAEHVRLGMRAWATNSARWGVSWDNFMEYVLPYSIIDEKRDLHFRWRSRFATLLSTSVSDAKSTTEAMHALAEAVPLAAPLGVFAKVNNGETTLEPGLPITWHSETSPEMLSPEQVSMFGGSCTGTAVVLVAAARSVGIPARMAGCSESVVRQDDHHWIEWLDTAAPGPFGDGWHTREGVSAGNKDGPWDGTWTRAAPRSRFVLTRPSAAPSGPMLGCLQGVNPGSNIDTLWVSAWSSDTQQPTLWAETTADEAWSRVGGINRCGAYCTAWGCGPDNAQKWNQDQCGPK